jgi:hypothetical protein
MTQQSITVFNPSAKIEASFAGAVLPQTAFENILPVAELRSIEKNTKIFFLQLFNV